MGVKHRRDSDFFTEILKRVKNSVVRIDCNLGHGSGFVIHESGIIATNRHVVENAEEVLVTWVNGTEEPARVIRPYRDIDLAFIKLSGKDYPSLQFDRRALTEGVQVYSLGNPIDYDFSITDGIVSALNRERLNTDKVTFIQTTAQMYPGSSGGPLINKEGFVVGMNTWIRLDADGLNFAIPSNFIIPKLNETLDKMDEYLGKKLCPICSSFNEKDESFCTICGGNINKALSEKEKTPLYRKDGSNASCPSCGKFMDKSQKYCKECGQSFLKNEENKNSIIGQEIICDYCSTKQILETNYCKKCGGNLSILKK